MWKFSIGNAAQRSADPPTAVAPSVSDSILPISNLATGYPDDEAAFEWKDDGNYSALICLNMLAHSSERTDANTGFRDLLLDYAGTPGLSDYPPDWNTYAGRTALRVKRPVFQDVEVMPGENTAISMGIYLFGNSSATAVQVRVTNTTTGLSWSGANNAWEDNGVVEAQAVANTWEDFTETIVSDNSIAQISTYRVIVEPVANSYSNATYVYVSGNGGVGYPAIYPEIDTVCFIDHNIPESATVSVGNFAFSTLTTPSVSVSANSEITQNYTLSIQMPSGNQPRPKIGELWMGKMTTLTRGVDPDVDFKEGDIAQLRFQTVAGRQEVVSDARYVPSYGTLKIRTFTDAQYTQYRDMIQKSTKFGAEPMLLFPPDELQGAGRIIHCRIGNVVSTKHKDVSWKEFSLEVMESPYAPK